MYIKNVNVCKWNRIIIYIDGYMYARDLIKLFACVCVDVDGFGIGTKYFERENWHLNCPRGKTNII